MGTTARAFRLSATYKCIRSIIRRVVRSISELESQSRMFHGKRYAIEILWRNSSFSWRIRTAQASLGFQHRPLWPCNMYGLQTESCATSGKSQRKIAIGYALLIGVHDALWSLKDVRTIYGESIVVKSRAAPLFVCKRLAVNSDVLLIWRPKNDVLANRAGTRKRVP
jgi:hypothetical protein